jgi:hypothetical protein
MVLDFEIKLVNDERRFGFSVIGGMDEGFPPCIDEVSPGKHFAVDLNLPSCLLARS